MISLSYEQIANMDVSMEAIQHLIPKFVTNEDCQLILLDCKKYIKNKKFEIMNFGFDNRNMTMDEFGNDIRTEFLMIISKYTQKNNYNYMDRLIFLRDTISKINMPEETEILSSMIEEFDVSKQLNKSTMLYYNKLYKLIYGETNE